MCWHFARIVYIQCSQPLYRLHIVIDTVCGNKWTRVTEPSQGFTAGKCWTRIQIPVLLFLQVKLFHHSSLPLPLEIIFISLVFFEANSLTCRVSFGPLLWCDPEQTRPWGGPQSPRYQRKCLRDDCVQVDVMASFHKGCKLWTPWIKLMWNFPVATKQTSLPDTTWKRRN